MIVDGFLICEKCGLANVPAARFCYRCRVELSQFKPDAKVVGRACLPFVAELGPLERRTITVEPSWTFKGDRLEVMPIPRGRLELVGAWAWHLVCLLPLDLWALLTSRPFQSWRLGVKVPPATIERLTVGVVDQIPGVNPLPAELFADLGPGLLVLDRAAAGLQIALTVSSYSHKPFTFRAFMFGDVFENGTTETKKEG